MTVEAVPIENIVRQHFIPAGLTFVYMPLTRLAADNGLWLRPFPSSPKEKKHIVVLFSFFLVISLLVDNHYVHHYSSHRSYPSAFPDPCKPNMPSNPLRHHPYISNMPFRIPRLDFFNATQYLPYTFYLHRVSSLGMAKKQTPVCFLFFLEALKKAKTYSV